MGFIIAIDGPSGSGKGSIANMLAKELEYSRLESGIYYRSIAYLMIENNITIEEVDKILSLLKNFNLEVNNKVILNNNDITDKIRSNDVTSLSAQISSINALRKEINNIIREYTKDKNIIVDGRDIGSCVLPNANIKIFLDCPLNIRAHRRYEQNIKNNISCTYEEILNLTKMRDEIDKNRDYGKLKPTIDAIIINTENKEVEESVNEILNKIRSELK